MPGGTSLGAGTNQGPVAYAPNSPFMQASPSVPSETGTGAGAFLPMGGISGGLTDLPPGISMLLDYARSGFLAPFQPPSLPSAALNSPTPSPAIQSRLRSAKTSKAQPTQTAPSGVRSQTYNNLRDRDVDPLRARILSER